MIPTVVVQRLTPEAREQAVDLCVREGFVDIGHVPGTRHGDVLRRMRYAPTGAGQRGTP